MNKVRTLLRTKNGKVIPTMIDDDVNVAAIIQDGCLRVFSFTPHQSGSSGETIFTEGKVYIVKDVQALKCLKD